MYHTKIGGKEITAFLPTRGDGLGFVTRQDVVVGQLVVPVAITLCKICISFNSGKLVYIEVRSSLNKFQMPSIASVRPSPFLSGCRHLLTLFVA